MGLSSSIFVCPVNTSLHHMELYFDFFESFVILLDYVVSFFIGLLFILWFAFYFFLVENFFVRILLSSLILRNFTVQTVNETCWRSAMSQDKRKKTVIMVVRGVQMIDRGGRIHIISLRGESQDKHTEIVMMVVRGVQITTEVGESTSSVSGATSVTPTKINLFRQIRNLLI